MKSFSFFSFVCAASLASGAVIGQNFDQVIAEHGQPVSQIAAGPVRVLNYSDVTIKFRNDVVTTITPVIASNAPKDTPLAAAAGVSAPKVTATTLPPHLQ